MPLYEYKCGRCGHVLEKLQSSPDAPAPEQCPGCQAVGELRRLVSNTSFQLKGSGWYVTDYASGSRSGSSSGSSVSSGEGESSPSPSSSSAPSGDGGGGGETAA